jgi:uncharacterized membrane protein YphA (DoxX/SURF4 family)
MLMFHDTPGRNTVASLVLRLALAAIFFYHGWVKVTGEVPGMANSRNTDWGASWATNQQVNHDDTPPQQVIDRLNAYVQMEKEKREKGENGEEKKPLVAENITQQVRQAYSGWTAAHYQQPQDNLHLQAWVQLLVAWGELIGGLAMLLGLATRVTALGLIVIQVGAIYLVTWARGFSAAVGEVGWEYNMALVAMCLALVFLGGGTLAVDGLIRHRRGRLVVARTEPVAGAPAAVPPAAPAPLVR